MKLYIAKVVWYCEGENDGGPITDYLIIAGDDFTEVMDQLEGYYKGDLDNVHIELINPDLPLVRLPNHAIYEAIKERGEI